MMSLCASAVLCEIHVSQMCLNIKDLDRVAVKFDCQLWRRPGADCLLCNNPGAITSHISMFPGLHIMAFSLVDGIFMVQG
jgi:hypothetical protein